MAGGTALVAAGYCYSWQNQSSFPHVHHLVSSNTTRCDPRALFSLRKHRTLQTLETSPSQQTLKHHYRVHWKQPLGEGTFGKVYLATRRSDGTRVAVKEISKHVTDSLSFQAEFQTLRQLRSHHGGHPNICSLIDNYASDTHYYLVLDLVNGPELFEHLVANGAYSEFEAARLIREVASALAFLHGLNIVHMDLKPENIMLSSSDTDQAVVKLVDFGTAISLDDPEDDPRRRVVNTVRVVFCCRRDLFVRRHKTFSHNLLLALSAIICVAFFLLLSPACLRSARNAQTITLCGYKLRFVVAGSGSLHSTDRYPPL